VGVVVKADDTQDTTDKIGRQKSAYFMPSADKVEHCVENAGLR